MARTVYQCREFEPVEVPLDRLIHSGQVQVYSSAEKYFDLDYRAGRLVVAPKSYVGLIPINDDVAIQVLPRFPISNLFHILHRSSATLRFIEGFTRSYEVEKPDSSSDPVAMLADQLIALGAEMLRSGLLRRYVSVSDDLNLGGSLDMSATVARFRVQGIPGRSAWVRTEHSYQLRENQLVKLALQRVVSYLARGGARVDLKRLRAAKELLFAFDRVALPSTGLHFDETELAQMVARLPSLHRQYAGLLWLSYLLHARRGISIEASGKAVFDTFVVNLADVFEDYVRFLIANALDTILPGAKAFNGNDDQVSLFVQGEAHKVKPDIYLLSAEGAPLAVLDAKYKPAAKASDRYEVIAFCEALQVKRAVILCPSSQPQPIELLGTTPGGIKMHVARINLNAPDMSQAEHEFLEHVKSLVQ